LAADGSVWKPSPERAAMGDTRQQLRSTIAGKVSLGAIGLKKSSGALRQQDLDNIVSSNDLLHLVCNDLTTGNESIFP
jgi:hypothetical protein